MLQSIITSVTLAFFASVASLPLHLFWPVIFTLGLICAHTRIRTSIHLMMLTRISIPHRHMLTYRCRGTHTPHPPWCQGHSVNIYWIFDGFTAYIITASHPPPHPPPPPVFLLLLMSPAGLSLFYHGVINHPTGSSSASSSQQFSSLKQKPFAPVIYTYKYRFLLICIYRYSYKSHG